MQIRTDETNQRVSLLTLSGSLDLYSSKQLQKEFISQLEKGQKGFIIQLSDLDYLDSSGVGTLLSMYTTCSKRSLPMYLAGVKGSALRTLELTKLEDFFPRKETQEEAQREVDKFQKSGVQMPPVKQILVDPTHRNFHKEGMLHKSFNIDLTHVRRLSALIAQKAPTELQEMNILEQQISELIKNAVKHGNQNDPGKTLEIWFRFSHNEAHLIIKDQGPGFQGIEKWNSFYKKKMHFYHQRDFDKMMDYLSYRTERSDDTDGGNAMFAAVEFWNQGVVFNGDKNTIAVKRIYH